jgi:hypothetical protein
MAAASYNMGMRGLENQTERQKAENYYDLLLNEETGRYVYRILSVKEIIEKPAQYGFHFRPKDLYPPYETTNLEVDTAVNDFADFAIQVGINYKILKILNPWLRDSYLTNPRKNTYQIKVPKDVSSGLFPYEMYSPNDFLKDSLSKDSI